MEEIAFEIMFPQKERMPPRSSLLNVCGYLFKRRVCLDSLCNSKRGRVRVQGLIDWGIGISNPMLSVGAYMAKHCG